MGGDVPRQLGSAGKSKGGQRRKGNVWLRQALVEAAWAASRTKGSSSQATYQRLAGRRGGKQACLAVGHRILRMVHRLLSHPRPYPEEGADYYRPTDKDRLKEKLVRRLRNLGYAVTVTIEEPAA